jgi:hypothetical protein
VEKASPLSEAEDNLGPMASDEDPIGAGDQTKSMVARASGVERTRSGFARLDPELEEGSSEPAIGGGGSGTHQRAPRPIESGVFSGGSMNAPAERASGGPAPAGQVGLSLQNALSLASRGEAELAALHRSLRDATRALTGSRHAHESLTDDLRMMHRGLSEVMSEKAAIERYAALLTQERDAALDAAEETRREAKREREFLLREQDRFIQLLLEEHEAEVQQLRRALGLRTAPQASPSAAAVLHTAAVQPVGASLSSTSASARSSQGSTEAKRASAAAPAKAEDADDVAPHTSPGLAPPPNAPPPLPSQAATMARSEHAPSVAIGPEEEEPTAPRALGMRARRELANGSGERHRAIPLPGAAERGAFDKSALETQRSESPAFSPKNETEERRSTFPPPPAVLDLDSLAHEVDGNSERPPPIRRIGVSEPKLHLRPARVPTQLLDTLVSKTGDEPTRKS